jgi:hypothetical protein
MGGGYAPPEDRGKARFWPWCIRSARTGSTMAARRSAKKGAVQSFDVTFTVER